jgi:hypothetical protein
VMRGEQRSVRNDSPGAGSSCLRRFARPRYCQVRPTSRAFWARSIVRIDAHGSKDRAKDASPERRSRSLAPAIGCLRFVA